MPDQAQTLKCVIINQSGHALVTTEENPGGDQPVTLNFGLDSGSIDGADTPPWPIADGETATFTITTPPTSSMGPQGWICYEIAPLKVVVRVVWNDAAASAGAEVACLVENRLTGAAAELDPVAVTVTDDAGAPMTTDAIKTASSYTATFTIKVKSKADSVPPPQPGMGSSNVAGPPGAGANVSGPKLIRKWDDEAMKQDPRRRKILAAVGNLFPVAFFLPPPKKDPSDEDKPPVPSGGPGDAHGGEKFGLMTFWSAGARGTSCTSTNIAIANLVLAQHAKWWAWGALEIVDKKWTPPACWVPWGSDPNRPMPQVGDVYVLYRDIIGKDPPVADTDSPHLRHCGFVLQVPTSTDEKWITADGGQRNPNDTTKQAAYLNSHSWKLDTPGVNVSNKDTWNKMLKAHPFAMPIDGVQYPFFGGGAESSETLNMADANRLIGWIDMNSPDITMNETFAADQKAPKTFNKISEADYVDLGRRIGLVK